MTKKKRRKKKPVTLEDVVAAAHAAGATVSVSLEPKVETRALLATPINEWPGDPTCRSIIADRVVTQRIIERAFKDSPTSKWVITPYDIIERDEFFRWKAQQEAEELRKASEVLCEKCGVPAAFPKLVTKPYTCVQCQQPQVMVGSK